MSWATAKLSSGIADVIRGVTFSRSDAMSTPECDSIPVLRAGNIAEHLIVDDDLVWIPPRFVSDDQRLRRNDIVICTSSGSRKIVGKSAINDTDFSGTWGAFNAVVRTRTSLNARFLSYWLQSPAFEVWRDRQATGANIQNIRHSALASLSVPLPPPTEQRRIVEILDQADALRKLRHDADAKADRILPALFLKMFGDPATNPMGWPTATFDKTLKDCTAGQPKLQRRGYLPVGLLRVVDQGQQSIAGYCDDPSMKFTGSLPVILFGDHTRIFKFVDHAFVLGADGVRVLKAKLPFNPVFLYWHCRMLDIPSVGYSRHFKFLKEKVFLQPDPAIQNQFADLANAIVEQVDAAQSASAKIESLFLILLNRAFSGQLTAQWRQAHMQELLIEMQEQARLLNLPAPETGTPAS